MPRQVEASSHKSCKLEAEASWSEQPQEQRTMARERSPKATKGPHLEQGKRHARTRSKNHNPNHNCDSKRRERTERETGEQRSGRSGTTQKKKMLEKKDL